MLAECKRCGYGWESRKETKPRQCPYCKSPKWDQERTYGGRPKNPDVLTKKSKGDVVYAPLEGEL